MAQAFLNASPSQVGWLDRLTAERIRLLGAKLRLFQVPIVPSPDTTRADFVAAEANFVGYASVVLVWAAIGVDTDGGYVAYSQAAVFTATDGTMGNSILGAWLEDSTGNLVEYWNFPAPINMTMALSQITAIAALREPMPDQLQILF